MIPASHVIRKKQFLENMEAKMNDAKFTADTRVLLASGFEWNLVVARELLESKLIALLEE